jgi:hypothetical protein
MLPQPELQVMAREVTTNTNATARAYCDTLGYDYAMITLLARTQAATTRPVALKLSCGTTTVVSSQTDIVAFTGTNGTVTDATHGFVTPVQTSATSGTDGYRVTFLVDCRARERYLGLSYSSGTGANTFSAIAQLFRADLVPATGAAAGLATLGLITEAGQA